MDVSENRVTSATLDDYLRKRLNPVEGVIPHLPGIEMFRNSIPAANADGDLYSRSALSPTAKDRRRRPVPFVITRAKLSICPDPW